MPECFGIGDEIKLGAYAVTEAGAGSDVRSLRTTAKLDGDEWILNGTKVFITNGGIADVTVVVATVDPELGHRGQASFVVPKDTPGLSHGQEGGQARHPRVADRRGRARGLSASRWTTCSAATRSSQKKLERARSGQSTGRSSGALATFELTRPLVGASALGIAQAAYEWTLEYLEGRSEDGVPLLEQQRIQQVLADVATEIEAARLLVWRAAWMGRNGVPMTGGQGSMSKLKAGDMAMWATTTLMDLVGPVRADHRLPAREVVPRREDLPAVRGHGPGPAPRDLAHAAQRVPAAAEGGRRGARAGAGHAGGPPRSRLRRALRRAHPSGVPASAGRARLARHNGRRCPSRSNPAPWPCWR